MNLPCRKFPNLILTLLLGWTFSSFRKKATQFNYTQFSDWKVQLIELKVFHRNQLIRIIREVTRCEEIIYTMREQ